MASILYLVFCIISILSVSVVVDSRHHHHNAARAPGSEYKIYEHKATLHRQLPSSGTAAVGANQCSKNDIAIAQGQVGVQPDGTPTFSVEIANICSTGCAITNIHLSCGDFSSGIFINPKIFKKLARNDCVVNSGEPLATGSALSFRYAAASQFPLSVSSLLVRYFIW
ncbi:hypothetical protein GH714_008820 [Hevea brasiliensis]|uniref:Uncharacterized protein n=1 Tax=Hevea brasiliensis TaxID=3981 RepID=A0A6A6MKZ5_HEVBR|nr:hypothetical protein GH714_008820 [Hevea brasiliensis]